MTDKSIAMRELREAMYWQKHLSALARGDEKKADKYLKLIQEIN